MLPSFYNPPAVYRVGDLAQGFAAVGLARDITEGDFHHDGKLGLAVIIPTDKDSHGDYTYSLSIFAGNGDGTFQNAVDLNLSSSAFPVAIVSGDFNGDGYDDLAAIEAGVSPNTGQVAIFLNNGKGAFSGTPSSVYEVGSDPLAIVAARFGGTSNLDLAVADYSSDEVSLLKGNGDGTFQPAVNTPVPFGPISLAVGDFQNNGRADLVVGEMDQEVQLLDATTPVQSSSRVDLLTNDGTGDFTRSTVATLPVGWVNVAAGDLNGDGIPDIVFSDSSGVTNEIEAAYNNGDGSSFIVDTQHNFAGLYVPIGFALGRVTGGARDDLIVAGPVSSPGPGPSAAVTVYSDLTAGGFTTTSTDTVLGFPYDSIIGDFTGDGRDDLAYVDGDNLDVLLSSPVSLQPMTLNAVEGTEISGEDVATFQTSIPSASASSFTATINWGDQTASTAGVIVEDASGTFHITGSHFYRVAGNYPVTVTLASSGEPSAQVMSAAGIGAAPISAQALAPVTSQGLFIENPIEVATFISTNPFAQASEYTARIFASNSVSAPAVVMSNGPGAFSVYVSGAAYLASQAGHLTFSVYITRPNGSETEVDGSLTVSPSTPVVVSLPVSVQTANIPFAGWVAAFSSSTPIELNNHFTASVDWGDGTPATAAFIVVVPMGGFIVANYVYATHTYGNPPSGLPTTDSIHVSIQADNGSSAGATDAVQVNPAPGTVPSPPPSTGDVNGPRVVGASLGRLPGQVEFDFQGNLSGLNLTTLRNSKNYLLTLAHGHGRSLTVSSVVVTPPTVPSGPTSVLVTFKRFSSVRGKALIFTVKAGVRDLAGNSLVGGDFAVPLRSLRKRR